MSIATTQSSSVSPVQAARKGKKYGYVSLAHALAATGAKVLYTPAEIAALEADDAPKGKAQALAKAINALPHKPGKFWAILEGTVTPPTEESKVFAGKGEKAVKALKTATAKAEAADLV